MTQALVASRQRHRSALIRVPSRLRRRATRSDNGSPPAIVTAMHAQSADDKSQLLCLKHKMRRCEAPTTHLKPKLLRPRIVLVVAAEQQAMSWQPSTGHRSPPSKTERVKPQVPGINHTHPKTSSQQRFTPGHGASYRARGQGRLLIGCVPDRWCCISALRGRCSPITVE